MVLGKFSGSRWEYAGVFLLLALMAVLLIASSLRESPTYDEVVHIPSGLSYLQKQDARLNLEHPPLLKIVAALPLLFSDVHANYNDHSWCGSGGLDCQWTFGQRFFGEWNRDPTRILFLARLPMILVTLCFGLTVYLMARALAGPGGARLSLTVFATSPLYLGYGPLVITDIGLALFCLLTAWLAATLWMRPNVSSMTKLSFAAAAALLSKFSAVLIFPSLGLFWMWMWLSSVRDRETLKAPSEIQPVPSLSRRKAPIYMSLSVSAALLLVFGFYWLTCFHSSTREILNERNTYVNESRPPVRILAAPTYFLSEHPRWEKPLEPLWLYLGGIGYLNAGLSRPVYLLGKLHGHGVWYYFPTVAFFKLAPGEITLLLLLAALTGFQLRREYTDPEQTRLLSYENRVRVRALISFLLVFTAAAMRARLNIGVRHISVPLSILGVLLALLIPQVRAIVSASRQKLALRFIGVLALSCVVTAVAAYPQYISYYNLFRMGAPKQEITTDSNLDWGQTLLEVRDFVARQQIQTVYVDGRMSPLLPATYIPRAKPWKCDNPGPISELPQWGAVSSNFLIKQEPTCIGLMRYQHWTLPGDAMVVFRITDDVYAESRRQYVRAHPKAPSVAPPVR